MDFVYAINKYIKLKFNVCCVNKGLCEMSDTHNNLQYENE